VEVEEAMTEAEWRTCADPALLLKVLCTQCGASKRKWRLFACACVRRIRHLIDLDVSRQAVEVAERFAEGQVSAEDREAAIQAAYGPVDPSADPEQTGNVLGALAAFWAITGEAAQAAEAAVDAVFDAVLLTGPSIPKTANRACEAHCAEEDFQCRLARDIFGPCPFSSQPAIASMIFAWNDGGVRSLAQLIYTECAFDRLPFLADALEDAGCTDRAILGHCRGPGPHVRGCWVVDLLLGKG
jgi:hypothetical protein